MLGLPFADICLFGRWSNEKSAREYFRRGEAELVRSRPDLRAVLDRCKKWGILVATVFRLRDAVGKHLQIERKRVTPALVEALEAVLSELGR